MDAVGKLANKGNEHQIEEQFQPMYSAGLFGLVFGGICREGMSHGPIVGALFVFAAAGKPGQPGQPGQPGRAAGQPLRNYLAVDPAKCLPS